MKRGPKIEMKNKITTSSGGILTHILKVKMYNQAIFDLKTINDSTPVFII